MKLEDYPDKVLVAIMHNGNEEVNEHIKEILESRIQKKSYYELYIKYIGSDEEGKKSLAEPLSIHLSNDLYFCEEEIFDDILNRLDVDYVWMLAVSSKNIERRRKARDKLYSMLDETFSMNECKNKMSLKMRIKKKEKRKK